MPSSRGSSQPRDQTHVSCVSCTAGRFLLLSHRERPSLFACVCMYVCIVCVYIYVYISLCHIFFFHAADNGHFSCFSVSINVNSATGNTGERVSFRSMISLRVEAPEWEHRSCVSFWLFKNLYAVLHCDCYQLTFSVTAPGGSLVPMPSPVLLSVVFLRMAIQTGARWFFVVVLIHSSLIISDVEHLFMCFQEKKEKKTVFVTWGDVLRLIYWRSTLFWIVFLFFLFLSAYPPQDTVWGQVSFTVRLLLLSQALGISRAPTRQFSTCCYKKCPQGGARLHVSLRLLGQQVLWPKSSSWL